MNDGRKGPKGPFIRFSEYQRSFMDCESRRNPYPSQKRILELADLLRLTQMQVYNWFSQRRQNARKERDELLKIPKLGENTVTGTFTRYTDDEIAILQREISDNPNPTDERKTEIANELGRTFDSIDKWFRPTTVSQNLKKSSVSKFTARAAKKS